MRKRRRSKGITARQKSARRKNIAIARKARKKGGKKSFSLRDLDKVQKHFTKKRKNKMYKDSFSLSDIDKIL